MADKSISAHMPKAETLFTFVFWGAIIAVAAFAYFKEDHVDILLDVSTQPELVSGMVTFAGTPVRGGVVRIVVSEVRSKRYLRGTTLSLSDDGKFTWQGQPALVIGEDHPPLRLSAEFHGTLKKDESKDKSNVKPLYGESTLYLNSSPPLSDRFLWCVATAVVVLLTFLLTVFTGNLGQRKARWLFILMYFFTFLSLALPIAISLVVSQNPYLITSMEDSPIGLVNAKTKVLTEPQWLINIGGTVRKVIVTTEIKPEPSGNALDEAGKTTKPTVGAEVGNPPAVPRVSTPELIVTGGIAVPFYVVLLAMFGAGINMTLKVPEVQRSSEKELPAAELPSFLIPWRFWRSQTEVQPVVSRKTASDIRQELIENYMYLLSAPFLAIAMYYLLQVLAEQVTQPVLVLMAFATGLISKAVIARIVEFAEKQLPKKERREGEISEQPNLEVAIKAAEAKKKQDEADAASRELDEAQARQTAAEAAAKAAKEAADEAEQKRAAVEAAAGTGGATQTATATAKEEAEKATREALAKEGEAEKAAEVTASAAKEAKAKEAEAEAAASAVQEAEAKQAAAQTAAAASAMQEAETKQAEARAAVEATKDAAQEAIEKQSDAEAAVKAAMQPAQEVAQKAEANAAKADADAKAEREATSPNPEAATNPAKKD
jgi:hypothetical protein